MACAVPAARETGDSKAMAASCEAAARAMRMQPCSTAFPSAARAFGTPSSPTKPSGQERSRHGPGPLPACCVLQGREGAAQRGGEDSLAFVASREDLERTYNRLARQIMSGTSDGGVDEHDAESSVQCQARPAAAGLYRRGAWGRST
eukprot:scaffold10001_cov106-Isochrysis_galbana.AAC.1